MMKQKFYETVDKYLMAMGIDVEEFAELSELMLKSIAVQAALECQSMFDVAWDYEPCSEEEVRYVCSYTPDLDDPALADKLRLLLQRRGLRLAAQA